VSFPLVTLCLLDSIDRGEFLVTFPELGWDFLKFMQLKCSELNSSHRAATSLETEAMVQRYYSVVWCQCLLLPNISFVQNLVVKFGDCRTLTICISGSRHRASPSIFFRLPMSWEVWEGDVGANVRSIMQRGWRYGFHGAVWVQNCHSPMWKRIALNASKPLERHKCSRDNWIQKQSSLRTECLLCLSLRAI
jgi:hypothetical protein